MRCALPYHGSIAVLPTQHAKERVIAPTLNANLGLVVEVQKSIDTDRFGTFTGEIPREGTQLDAAKAKIAMAFEVVPSARIAIASEGSFGPHPAIPFLALGRELVVLEDRDKQLVLVGHYSDIETNYSNTTVTTIDQALRFAEASRFPSHGLNVLGWKNNEANPTIFIDKDVTDAEILERSVGQAIGICGAAFIQTDMRANRNPTRMKAIERATEDLVRLYMSRCPNCSWPGFDVTERVPGLPCSGCGEPTSVIYKHVLLCTSCNFRDERPATNLQAVDPGQCQWCNS